MSSPRLGSLEWRPATEHPELLAAPVAAALARADLDCYVAAIEADLADTAEFCAAYQVAAGSSANCVLVEGRRGEQTTRAACLVLATDRADVNKTVRRHLDVRKISFASPGTAVTLTGMQQGGITPLGLPDGWPVLVDTAVAQRDWLVVGSGIRGSKLAITGPALAGLPGATVLALTLTPHA